MSRGTYYNENDPFTATWLEELIAAGAISSGWVDQRSIADVQPEDLERFDRCHFFAGIGGWDLALRIAGWPAQQPVWTGSPPCQPYSVAGERKGDTDPRNLWPEFRRLIEARRPPVVFGEQSANASRWLAGVRGDLGALDYAMGAIPLEATLVGADHRRERYYFVADTDRVYADRSGPASGNARFIRPAPPKLSRRQDLGGEAFHGGQRVETTIGPIKIGPHMDIVAHGVPGNVALLRGAGNAIVPALGAKFIQGYVKARQGADAGGRRALDEG